MTQLNRAREAATMAKPIVDRLIFLVNTHWTRDDNVDILGKKVYMFDGKWGDVARKDPDNIRSEVIFVESPAVKMRFDSMFFEAMKEIPREWYYDVKDEILIRMDLSPGKIQMRAEKAEEILSYLHKVKDTLDEDVERVEKNAALGYR